MENDDLKKYINKCNHNLDPTLPILYEAGFF